MYSLYVKVNVLSEEVSQEVVQVICSVSITCVHGVHVFVWLLGDGWGARQQVSPGSGGDINQTRLLHCRSWCQVSVHVVHIENVLISHWWGVLISHWWGVLISHGWAPIGEVSWYPIGEVSWYPMGELPLVRCPDIPLVRCPDSKVTCAGILGIKISRCPHFSYCLFAFTWAPEVAEVLRDTQARVILTTSCMFAGSSMRR